MIHLLLLTLALLFVWETLQSLLPARLPAFANVLLLAVAAYLLDRFVADHWLGLGAVVAVVGVLHQRFGSSPDTAYVLRRPDLRKGARAVGRIPPLP